MRDSGESLRDDPGAPKERGTWVEQQLGEGWTQVEPGIYRFTAGERPPEAAVGPAPPADPPAEDLIDALEPKHAEPETPRPTGRLFGRRVRR